MGAGRVTVTSAAVATEPDADRAGGDTKHLVHGAVVVMMRVDAIAPSTASTVALKQSHASRIGPGAGLKYAAVDDQR